ncbi:MAG TPA: aminoacyl-tRNA hydrolase [Patescibacteria group bacterium]|nr:aminoacyl-tRNA hydrolase [Patescibacteria group bacterium]
MKLIVGLGNPGKTYTETRHNIGKEVVKTSCPLAFHRVKKLEAEIARVDDVVYALPDTYMNESGRSVQRLRSWFTVSPEDIWVVHDDLDFPFGLIKIQQGGGAAGHNGILSVMNALGTDEFVRFRMGIGKPSRVLPEKYVLSRFSRDEKKQIPEIKERFKRMIDEALRQGVPSAMSLYNRRIYEEH